MLFAIFCLPVSEAMCQDMERRVIKALAPPYDDITLQSRLEGTIKLEVRVGPSGEVQRVQVIQPVRPPGWRNDHWEQYASEWRFEPGETTTTEEIVFRFRFVPRDSPPKDQGTMFFAPATVEIRHLELPPATSHAVPRSP